MQRIKVLRYGVILSFILLLAGVGQGLAAPLAQDRVWMISFPRDGSTVSGVVAIQGTATHPSFVSYGILYASGDTVTGSTLWRQDSPIIWNNQTMVVNGTLGTWDTTVLPNGKYVLALVVYEAGVETPNVYFVQNLTVQNEADPHP